MDAIRELLSFWFDSGEENFRHVDEIHEAHETQSKLSSFKLNFGEFVELLADAQQIRRNSV